MSIKKGNRLRRHALGDRSGRRWWVKCFVGHFPFRNMRRWHKYSLAKHDDDEVLAKVADKIMGGA